MSAPSSPLIEQILSGRAPRKVKEFAAQGLLPIPQDELIPVQVFLTSDSEPAIANQAQSTLEKITEDVWRRLLEKKEVNPDIVRFCLKRNPSASIKETILLNAAVPDELLRQMAASESGRSLDIILNNQVRLLRDPELLKFLEQNRLLSIDQKRRLEEFKTEFLHKKQQQRHGVAVEEEPAAGPENLPFEDLLALVPGLDAEAKRIIEEADQRNEERPTDEQVQAELQRIFPMEEIKDLPEDTLSTYQRIMKMKQGEKVRVALLGNRGERALLIRDTSRQVSGMVLKSPKLTDSEVENFAQWRNLDGDILRQIGQHREFIKKYSIVYHLVKNPKTPSSVSINLLKLLRESDLKNLERDKNIPEVIRRQAKKSREMKSEKHG